MQHPHALADGRPEARPVFGRPFENAARPRRTKIGVNSASAPVD
jgi:hypothetical protein